MGVLERPAIGIARAAKGLLSQPARMKKAYVAAGVQYLLPELSLIRVLRGLVEDASRTEIKAAVEEGARDPHIRRVIEQADKVRGILSVREMVFLHALVCLKKPAVVVETGVAHGSSSVAILSAMEKVQAGVLHSIDLPMIERNGEIHPLEGQYQGDKDETTTVPDYGQVGWLVSSALRRRWILHLGNSLHVLPSVVGSVKTIDLFLHDSLHRYDHMMREFEVVWPVLSAGAVLLADDIFVFGHAAIADFSRLVGTPFRCYFGMGIMRKVLPPAGPVVGQATQSDLGKWRTDG